MPEQNYSDDAAAVFAVAALGPYFVGAVIWLSYRTYQHVYNKPKYPKGIDALQEAVIDKERKRHASLKRLFTTAFTVNLVLSLVAGYCLLNLVSSLSAQAETAEYDPFHILSIDRGVTDAEIKSAYRKLSLLYHPDKNPGNEEAARKFMEVSKAYETLTDPTAKENWELYGNPDGKQSLAVSIGLPSWFVRSDSKTVVVLSYVFVLVVVVPALVFYCKGTDKVTLTNQAIAGLHREQSKGCKLKDYPEMMSLLPDLFEHVRRLKIGNDDPYLAELEKELKVTPRSALVPDKSLKLFLAYPVWLSLLAYLHRMPVPPLLQVLQAEFLVRFDIIIKTLLDLSGMPRPTHIMREGKKKPEPLNYSAAEAVRNLIGFQTRVTQRLWLHASPLMQIPNFTEDVIQYCKVGGKRAAAGARLMTFLEYIALPREERKGLRYMTPQQKEEVEAFMAIVPQLLVQCSVHVAPPHGDAEFIVTEPDSDEEGSGSDTDSNSKADSDKKQGKEDGTRASAGGEPIDFTNKITSGFRERDIITCTISMTHNNVPEDADDLPPVYTPFQDKLQKELWYVLVLDEKDALMCVDVNTQACRVMKSEVKFQAPKMRKGHPYKFKVEVWSGNYVELMYTSEFQVEVTEALPADASKQEAAGMTPGDGSDTDSDDDGPAASGRDTGAEGDSENEGTPQSNGGSGFSDDATLARQLGLTEAQLRQRKKRLERKAATKKKGGDDGDDADTSAKPHED